MLELGDDPGTDVASETVEGDERRVPNRRGDIGQDAVARALSQRSAPGAAAA
jgi:hypothetical protein